MTTATPTSDYYMREGLDANSASTDSIDGYLLHLLRITELQAQTHRRAEAIADRQAEALIAVCSIRGDDGKSPYSNEKLRDAAVREWLKENDALIEPEKQIPYHLLVSNQQDDEDELARLKAHVAADEYRVRAALRWQEFISAVAARKE